LGAYLDFELTVKGDVPKTVAASFFATFVAYVRFVVRTCKK